MGGDIEPDSMLPSEAALASEYGVSRTVVREAMRLLAGRGLVVVRHGIPTRVAHRDDWNVLDRDVLRAHRWSPEIGALLTQLIEARKRFEVPAAEMAATRANAEQRAAIVRASSQFDEGGPDDEGRLVASDVAFHRAILRASGNRFFYHSAAPLHEHMPMAMERIAIPDLERARGWHHQILEAILRRDGHQAGEAMDKHLSDAETRIRRTVDAIQADPTRPPESTGEFAIPRWPLRGPVEARRR